MRRIEGFEKRQRAKPKRCLAHPPAFVRAFQDPPTPLGECRLVLPTAGGCVARTAMPGTPVSFLRA